MSKDPTSPEARLEKSWREVGGRVATPLEEEKNIGSNPSFYRFSRLIFGGVMYNLGGL